MKWFQELTKWVDPAQPNHTYLMNDSRSQVLAYVRQGTVDPVKFKIPMRINLRGRQFREVPDQWHLEFEQQQPQGRVFQVAGSQGNTYTVTEHAGSWTCTCSGFRFRSQCKHLTQAQSM